MRPILATESREVSASADTHMVMNTVATVTGTPIFSRNPATPEEKMEKGVPSGFVPFTATAPTTTSATTPSRLSTIMAPYPTMGISFSLLMVLEEVPEDTRLWNPDTAPQAIVTNSVGNKLLLPT